MKQKTIYHFIAVALLALSSVLFLTSWMPIRIENNMPLYIFFTIVSFSAGYTRSFLPYWIRWCVLGVVFMTVCMVTDGKEWGISWMAMHLCIFSWAIVVRRIVMQKTGNTTIAPKSFLRELYNVTDAKYSELAAKLGKNMELSNPTMMVSVAHAASIMSFALLFLFIAMDSYDSRFEFYGYWIFAGMTLVIPLVYAIWSTRQNNNFLSSLASAFAMFFVGVAAMIACFFLALMSIIAITTLISAISNLFHKFFGRD